MPRRSLLTATERSTLLAFPIAQDEMIRHCTFGEAYLAVIRQHRGGQNRLGFAVQLCALRYPGCALSPDAQVPDALLAFVARQLRVEPDLWSQYAQRAETRREHLIELQAWLALTPFSASHFRHFVEHLTDLARQTERGIVLANALLEALRREHVIVPAVDVIERVCAQALTQGTRKVYEALTPHLTAAHQQRLDELLTVRENATASSLAWLRQPPGTPLKTGETTSEFSLLLTALLADGINLGLSKMAESCPGVTYARLSWLQAWHIRDDAYAALAELVNAQSQHAFSDWWGDGSYYPE